MASSCHHPQLAVFSVFARITVNSLQTSSFNTGQTLESLIRRDTGLYDPGYHRVASSVELHARAAPPNLTLLSLIERGTR